MSNKQQRVEQNTALVDANWNKKRARWPAFGQTHNKCRNEQLKRYIAAIQRESDGQRARRGPGLVMESQPALRAVTAKVQIRTPKRRQPTTRRWVPCGPRTRRYRGANSSGREGTRHWLKSSWLVLAPDQSMCKTRLCECSLRESHTLRARHARIGGEEAPANKS